MAAKVLFQKTTRSGLGGYLTLLCARRAERLARGFAASKPIRMSVFAHDLIGIEINHFGVYEGEQLQALFAFLEPLGEEFAGGTALDIGANIGNHTLFFAGRFHRVHAVEPNPTVFRLLQFNASQMGNATVHNIGLGDETGTFDLHEVDGNLGASSIRPIKGVGEGIETVGIDVRRLDDVQELFGPVCFVKMDVEGFEQDVLRGGRDFLTRNQPLVVLEQLESEFRNGTTPAISILKELGYRFCWLHSAGLAAKRGWGGRVVRLVESLIGRRLRIVSDNSVPPNTYSMLVAVPPRHVHRLNLD